MTGYVLAKDADSDLQGIYWFTHERWGEKQAEFYINDLFATFENLARHPQMGRLRPELGPKIRSLPRKRHSIYYVVQGDEIAIARVLHGAMDVESAHMFEE